MTTRWLRKIAYENFVSHLPGEEPAGAPPSPETVEQLQDDEFDTLVAHYAPPTSKEVSDERMAQKSRVATAKGLLLRLAKLSEERPNVTDPYRAGDRRPYAASSIAKEVDDWRGVAAAFGAHDADLRGAASDTPPAAATNPNLTGDA